MGSLIQRADLESANHASPEYAVGQYHFDSLANKLYRYVKVTIGGTNANSLIAKRPVYYDDPDAGTVKTDMGGGKPGFAGVLLNTVTSGNYAWIQCQGVGSALVTNSLAASRKLIPDAANGLLKVASAATDVHCGETMAAAASDASTTGAVIRLNGF